MLCQKKCYTSIPPIFIHLYAAANNPALEGDSNEEEPEGDGFDTEKAFFVGSLLGFAYEEGRLREEKRKRKNVDSDNPSDID